MCDLNNDGLRLRDELYMSILTLTIVLGAAATFWNGHNAAMRTQSARPPVGYTLNNASFSATGMYGHIRKMVKEVASSCCCKHQELPRDNDREQQDGEFLGGRAHLGHEYFHTSPPGTKMLTRWSPGARLRSYVKGSVEFSKGSLVVSMSGYYFVYSQASFVKALHDWRANQASVTHELLLFSNAVNETRVILRAQKTHCWNTMVRCSLDASYLGATFYLQKGDRVFVAVSDANFMWQSPRRTYFGMQLLS